MTRTLTLLALLTLSACAAEIQTTSGKEYTSATGANGPLQIDAEIAQIARVEPNLRFPARIGVARIVNGDLALPTAEETALLTPVAERHAALGTFIPISPLIAGMVNAHVGNGVEQNRYRCCANTNEVVQEIRRTAARQHLDYVLIYEVGARSRESGTPFALADVTLIGGAFLPTRNIKVTGIGQAIFLDVRNGYPYGTAMATEDLSGLARSFGTNRRAEALRDKASLKVTAALIPEVDKMLTLLQAEAAK